MTEQRLCKQNLDLFRVLQGAQGTVKHFCGVQTQTFEQLACLGVGIPAVHLSKLGLELSGTVAVLLGEGVVGVDLVLFLHDLIQTRIALDDGVQNGEIVVREVVLLEHGHARTGFDGNIARRRVQLARQDFQEGGLACAVCADDAVAVALGEFDVDFFEQRFSAEVQADVGYGNHSSSKSHYYESRYIISCFRAQHQRFCPFP